MIVIVIGVAVIAFAIGFKVGWNKGVDDAYKNL